MASGDASQLAESSETRLAPNGRRYTKKQFLDWYGEEDGNRRWALSEEDSDANASVLASGGWSDGGASQSTESRKEDVGKHIDEQGNASRPRDAPQPARGSDGACDPWSDGACDPWSTMHWNAGQGPTADTTTRSAAQLPAGSHQVPVDNYRNAAQLAASSDNSVAVLSSRARLMQALTMQTVEFGAEGLRHTMLIIKRFLGRPPFHRCPLCVNALATACKSVHCWFYAAFDEGFDFRDDAGSGEIQYQSQSLNGMLAHPKEATL